MYEDMVRVHAHLDEAVEGGAQISDHILRTGHCTLRTCHAAKVEAQEAKLRVVGVQLKVREPVLAEDLWA